jgi:hypothetical protein
VRDDQIRSRLAATNPWWGTAAAASRDPQAWASSDLTLTSRSRYDLGYRASVLDDVATGPLDDRLIVLRGPRRVGKSVVMKDAIFGMCAREDLDTRQLIYIAADELTPQDLHRSIVLGRELTRSVDQSVARTRVWFIDEVTSLDGWTSTLKFLRDNTPFGLDLVVCSGSSWADVAEVGRDLLAGRAGAASVRRTRILVPMSFRDFAIATRPELPRPGPFDPWSLQSEAVADAAAMVEFSTDALDLAWQAYLSCGGYPRAVSEYHRDGFVSDAFLTDIEAWLHRDVDRNAPEESIPQLLAELHRCTGAPLNRTRVARGLGYPNRQAFDLRLVKLVRTFAALWCHQVREDGHRVAGAQAKLYLSDPIMAWLPTRLRSGVPDPDMTRLTESALAVGLAARVESLQPGRWAADEAIGYRRTGGNVEVDLAPAPLPTPAGDRMSTPIEVKWVSHGWRPEVRGLEREFGGGIVATKNLTDTSHPSWALPAPLVALLLE